MGNFKVRVNSQAESKEAQELFFKSGGKWCLGGCKIKNTDEPYLYLENGLVFHGSSAETFNTEQHKEITLPELRAMVQPMKEYLGKQENGTYKLISASGGCVDRDWIEVPEGAIRARFYPHDPDELEFENSNHQWWHGENKEWTYYADYAGSVEYSRVVWRRTPSLKDQYLEQGKKINDACASVFKKQDDLLDAMLNHSTMGINDQYAETEQVRQASKDNVNNPQHYNKGGVECIDAIEASMTPEAFKGYLKGNVQKYMWRYEQKGGVESLRKAQWYLERLIASMGS